MSPSKNLMNKELADEEALRHSLDNPNVFEVIVNRYQEPFLRVARRIIKSKQDAEDICQETFVKIYLNAKKFRKVPGASFKSWAYKILVNTAFINYRKLKKTLNSVSYRDDILVDDKMINAAGAYDQKEEIEVKDFIEKILSEMPEDMQQMIKQHYLNDQSYKTMAAMNNTTLGAIRMKIFRARKIFRDLSSMNAL